MASKRLWFVIPLSLAAACGGGSGGGGDNSNPPTPAQNRAPSIAGIPDSSIRNGSPYEFEPQASDADGDALTFTIENLPGWLEFNSDTGALTGTALAADIGTYNDIAIRVSDGSASATLAPFSIDVTSNPVAFELTTSGNVAVDALNVVSIRPGGNGEMIYELAIEVTNESALDLTDVTASLDRRPENLGMFDRVDGSISIPSLGAGATATPADTFEVVVNSGNIDDLEKLIVEFDDASLDGIDTDLNGYRDDVETLIRAEFSAAGELERRKTNDLAVTLGAVLSQTVTLQMLRTREAEIDEIGHCLVGSREDASRVISILYFLVFDTDARRAALKDAGMTLAIGGLIQVSERPELDDLCINRYGSR